MKAPRRPPRFSPLEQKFALLLHAHGIDMQREYRFHPTRRWRFDFADPDHMIAVELDGGAWVRGRHHRPQGYAADCEKLNEATRLGWRVFRYSSFRAASEFPEVWRELALQSSQQYNQTGAEP